MEDLNYYKQRAEHFEKEFDAANKEIIFLNNKLCVQPELKDLYFQQSVMNPYSEGSQSNTAYKKGFYECFEHFFKPNDIKEQAEHPVPDCPVCGWSFDSADHAQNCSNYLNEGKVEQAEEKVSAEEAAERYCIDNTIEKRLRHFVKKNFIAGFKAKDSEAVEFAKFCLEKDGVYLSDDMLKQLYEQFKLSKI